MTLPPPAEDHTADADDPQASAAYGVIGSPTMSDVAHQAGVSPMTVSRTLRDDPRVSPETKSRVLGAVNALGYRRNEAARNLRLGRSSGLIGRLAVAAWRRALRSRAFRAAARAPTARRRRSR